MKSKLSVALAAAGCVLAAGPANAITVNYNPIFFSAGGDGGRRSPEHLAH